MAERLTDAGQRSSQRLELGPDGGGVTVKAQRQSRGTTAEGSGDRAGNLRLLIVDTDVGARAGLRKLVESSTTEVREAANGSQALEVLGSWRPHLLLTDIATGEVSGMDLLDHVRQRQLQTAVLIIASQGTVELAVAAMRSGAADFVSRPYDRNELQSEVRRLGCQALTAERAGQTNTPSWSTAIVAEDKRMVEVLKLARRVAPTGMPVLIRGESGTGKEFVAREIHESSRDPSRPFLPVNSAALPDTLLESELFGHVKGAFTGADNVRQGIFAQAKGGTVFLDEIGLMSLAFQGKLLRVLQERIVVPLGSSTAQPVSFRLLAATNRGLRKRIETGEFREDLYFRLRVVTINVPPLRERPDDIIPLAMHFIATFAGRVGLPPGHRPRLTDGALAALQGHPWPGNVRELENSIQRALILSRGESIDSHHLNLDEESEPWVCDVSEKLSYEDGKKRVLDAYQRRTLGQALRDSQGNVSKAAQACGLSRAAFQRIMRSLDLDRHEF